MDEDGLYTSGVDTPIEAVTVNVMDSKGASYGPQTNADGRYSQAVAAGIATVNVDESDPDFPETGGLTPLDPNGTGDNQNPGSVDVPVGGVGVENAGYLPSLPQEGTVIGHVYEDSNGSGTQDAGEPDLPNVSVEVTDANSEMQTVVTDGSGDYSATVPAGTTVVEVDETTLPFVGIQTEGENPTTVTAVAGQVVDAGNDGYYRGPPQEVTQTVSIAERFDDSQERPASGAVNPTSEDLQLIPDKTIGLRFVGLGIPKGSTILSAQIELVARRNGTTATNVVIYGEASDSALSYTTTPFDLSSRDRTAASVAWSSVESWSKDGSYVTPELTSIVQELVNRAAWTEASAMAFQFNTLNGQRDAVAYDKVPDGPDKAAQLTITYRTGGGTAQAASVDVKALDGRLYLPIMQR
jgi:hypothetical protein